MISVDDALKIVLENINTLADTEVKLTDGLDRVLKEDIYSSFNVPQYDNSAMDGYAVRYQDIQNVSKDNPVTLDIIEELAAGSLSSKIVGENLATKIMTGALIPQGADSVIKIEDTEYVEKNKVRIFNKIPLGKNVRKKGEDIKNKELVLSRGTFLKSSHIGLLASLGKQKINVIKNPKIAILATGDEVINIDEKLDPGKLYSSNTYSLFCQIIKCGGTPKILGIAKDNAKDLEEKIKNGFDCDLILTSGGVSVGDYDLVKSTFNNLGADIKFWKVSMRPGKPLVFGIINGIPWFGLPGNPVSSMVSFEIFVKPAIFKMTNQKLYKKTKVEAVLKEDITKKSGLRSYLRAKTFWKDGHYITTTTGPQGSGILKSMVYANSLIILPEEKEVIKKNTKVSVMFLNH